MQMPLNDVPTMLALTLTWLRKFELVSNHASELANDFATNKLFPTIFPNPKLTTTLPEDKGKLLLTTIQK